MNYLINFDKEKDHIRFSSYELYCSEKLNDYNHYFHFEGVGKTSIKRMLFVLENSGKINNVSIEKKGQEGSVILRISENKELIQYTTFFETLLKDNQEKIEKGISKIQMRMMLKGIELEDVLQSYS